MKVEVEDGLVGDVESGRVLRERMRVGPDVEHHQGAEATALGRPTRAEGLLAPAGGRAGDGAAQGDEADATVRQVGEGGTLLHLVRGVIFAIEDDDLVLIVLRVDDLAGAVGLRHDGAGPLELFDQGFDGDMVVGDDRDLDRGGAKGDGREGHDDAQEGADAGKHGSIKLRASDPTRLSSTPSRNLTPLKCTFTGVSRP